MRAVPRRRAGVLQRREGRRLRRDQAALAAAFRIQHRDRGPQLPRGDERVASVIAAREVILDRGQVHGVTGWVRALLRREPRVREPGTRPVLDQRRICMALERARGGGRRIAGDRERRTAARSCAIGHRRYRRPTGVGDRIAGGGVRRYLLVAVASCDDEQAQRRESRHQVRSNRHPQVELQGGHHAPHVALARRTGGESSCVAAAASTRTAASVPGLP